MKHHEETSHSGLVTPPDPQARSVFQRRMLDWYRLHGRKDLPWQRQRTPYRVWVSEIMLQQTQVETVIPFFKRFVARFPDVRTLADASLDHVIECWAGLGYYARARHLHRAAITVAERFSGEIPREVSTLTTLPGIGRSTAGAIVSLGFKQPAPILDGNVKRVLSRYHGIDGWPGAAPILRQLWAHSERLTPAVGTERYNQAMMDLGAMVCTPRLPRCALCPLVADCAAHRSGLVDKIPSPKPRRSIPTRKALMLLLTNSDGHIYLEKRPPSGIWGGLWCLPTFGQRCELSEWAERLGVVLRVIEHLPQRRHTFSHFHLDYVPVRAESIGATLGVRESSREHWHPRGPCELGLPAPIRRLLTDLDYLERPEHPHDQTGTLRETGHPSGGLGQAALPRPKGPADL